MRSGTKVYRFEKNGLGPYTYRSNDWSGRSLSEAHRRDDRPGIAKVLRRRDVDPDYHSACDSPKSLRAWFYGWNGRLRAAGFKVVCYEVPHVRRGKFGQVAFRMSQAKRLDTAGREQ